MKSQTPEKNYKNRPSCAASVIASFFALVFITSLFLTVMLINVEFILLRPQIYKKVLSAQAIYETLPDLISRQFIHSFSFNPCLEDPKSCEGKDLSEQNGGPPPYLKNMSESDWEQILALLLTPVWIQNETENAIDQFFTALDEGKHTIEIVISLQGFKENFNDKNSAQITSTLLDQASPCTEEELLKITSMIQGQPAGEIPFCLPAEELKPLLQDELQSSMVALVEDLQNDLTLKLDLLGEKTGKEDKRFFNTILGDHPLERLKTLRSFLLISVLIPITALLMIVLFSVRSWFAFFRWLGIPILISGGFLFLPAIISLPIYRWLVATFLLPNIPSAFTPEMVNMLISSLQGIISRFMFWVGLEAGLLVLIGGGMLLLSIFFPTHRQPNVIHEG